MMIGFYVKSPFLTLPVTNLPLSRNQPNKYGRTPGNPHKPHSIGPFAYGSVPDRGLLRRNENEIFREVE